MNKRCPDRDECKNMQTPSIIRKRYRRSLIVGRASYFSGFLLSGSWIFIIFQLIRQQIAVVSVLTVSLCLFPFFFVWIISLHTWRFLLHFLIRSRNPDLDLVNTHSLRCALDTHRWPGLAIALLLLQEQGSDLNQLQEKVLKLMQAQIDKHVTLRRRLTWRLGCYMWRKDDPTLTAENQLFVWPKKATNDSQLQDIVGLISSRPLPKDRPPWEVFLIPYGRGYCVLLRAHHLVVDRLPPFIQLLSPTSCSLWENNPPPLLRRTWAVSKITSTLWTTILNQLPRPDLSTRRSSMTDLVSSFLFLPMNLVKFSFCAPHALIEQIRSLAGDNIEGKRYFHEAGVEMWEAIKMVLVAPHVFATQLTSPVENVPLLRACASPGYRVLAWTPPVTRNLVRKVAKAGNATDVQVLLAACAGALRRFLTGADPPESVSAVIPVTVGERKTAAFALVDLPTGQWDPVERLRRVRRQMEAVKERPLHVIIGAVVMRYASFILPQTLLTLALNFLSRRHTITVCFVDTPVNVMPHNSRLFYWRPPQGNAGLTFTLLSTDERVSLTVASNQRVLPRSSELTSNFSCEMQAMAVALKVPVERRSVTSSKPRK